MSILPKEKLQQAKGMLADMSIAQHHPETLAPPDQETTRARRVMHLVHRSLYTLGARLDTIYDRKHTDWSQGTTDVIGYGGEKIAYRVKQPDSQDTVVSVYHKDSLLKDPTKLLEQKRARYNTYVQYFENLVVPTNFTMVDNPWGDGEKPASIQEFIEDASQLSDLSLEEVLERKQRDANFAESIDTLKSGYANMIEDGLCPDFASSNVIVTPEGVRLFDTGVVYPSSAVKKLKSMQPNYKLIEFL